MTLRSTLLLTTAFAGLWTGAAQAQLRCGSDEARRELIARDPHLLEREAAAEAAMQHSIRNMRAEGEDNTVYVIPVVFHIVHQLGAENISDAQIHDAMEVLNRDYSLLNADVNDACCGFRAIAANIHLQFRLAQIDPYGQCTNGIDRIMSLRTNNAGDGSKLDPWFRERYLNVWVVNTIGKEGTAGYSYYPSDVTGAFAIGDGVLILNDYIGRIGTGTEYRSRALTHEVGHWLNLQHPWGNNNGEDGAPAGHMVPTCGDDLVEDTPWTRGHNICSPGRDYDCSRTAFNQLYRCDSVTTSTGTADPVIPVDARVRVNDTTFRTVASFTRLIATGVSGNSVTAGRFEFTGWGTGAPDGATAANQLTGAIDLHKYYEFTIGAPQVGTTMTLDSLEFKVVRNLTGARSFAVRSSVDNFASNLPRGVQANNSGVTTASGNTFFYTLDTNLVRNNIRVKMTGITNYRYLTGAVTFRIYAWNAEEDGGSFGIDDLRPYGTFGIIENLQNYMDYSYCSVMFTNGQRDRMRAAITSSIASRNNLWTDANLAQTGTEDGHVSQCAPRADFYSYVVALNNAYPFTCANSPVQFRDNSQVATPTSWQWEFPGGDSSSSTEQNPIVRYPQGGTFSATLTVSNEYGSNSITKTNVAYVSNTYPDIMGLMSQPFNTPATPPWIVFNPENNTTKWEWTAEVGHSPGGGYRMNGSKTTGQDIIGDAVGDVDELVTPTMDLTYLTNATFSFWYAASTKAATSADVQEHMTVYSSTNCGASWSARLNMNVADGNGNHDPSQLITAGTHGNGYIPAAADWRQASFTIPAALQRPNVRFKFSYTAGRYSNDLFVDDVNIDGTVGVDEVAARSGFLALTPNPAADEVTVEMDLAGSAVGTLSFVDPTGRVIHSRAVSSGQQYLVVDLKAIGLSSGVYLVRLEHAKGKRVQRLVVR
ncbi:MAG: M43 family zinc metalloprotease [Flavobacteriales bacterium]